MTKTRVARRIRLGRPRWLVVAAGLVLLATACGDDGAATASTTSTAAPTQTAASVATTSEATTTTEPTTTTTGAITTTSSVSAEQLAAAAAVGDMAVGEALFNEKRKVAGAPTNTACSTCHSLDADDDHWAPPLVGISAAAGDRVEGLSAVEYLRQSIMEPSSFLAIGEWAGTMPYGFPDALSEDQIDDLIAFLLTR